MEPTDTHTHNGRSHGDNDQTPSQKGGRGDGVRIRGLIRPGRGYRSWRDIDAFRKRCRALGLCAGCGRPPDAGYKTCGPCRERRRRQRNVRRELRRLRGAELERWMATLFKRPDP